MQEVEVLSLNVGRAQDVAHGRKTVATAIRKRPVTGRVRLGRFGFEGDEQADLVHHGGPDKAVCVYASEHFAHWAHTLGLRMEAGAFGENLTIAGTTEADVSIGDVFEFGSALIQVSQPRQPCFKLGLHHECVELPAAASRIGYTGFYFRVLREGTASAVDRLKRVDAHPLTVDVAFVNRIKYVDRDDRAGLERILKVEALAEGWRNSFLRRYQELSGQ